MKYASVFILLLFSLPSFSTVITSEDQFSTLSLKEYRAVDQLLSPTRMIYIKSTKTLLKTFIEKGTDLFEVHTPEFAIPECLNSDKKIIALELKDKRYAVKKGNKYYRFQTEIYCNHENHLVFKYDSPEGELIQIWDILLSAENFFLNIGRIDFWQKRINIEWPSNGDYYWRDVNITNGHHWDVVAHELGHAIYDQAQIGIFGGGMHKIDECYSHELALSEGWASFFAAWIKVDISDPNAAFEYLVPRRAPIQIENVPKDVCLGPTNEWRVTSYLWDFIDLNAEVLNEKAEVASANIWDVFHNGKYNSIDELSNTLSQKIVNKNLNNFVWELNFNAK
ncbi:MAG: hypothetical protein KDD58_10100 [Bdellovibrionales bacterium]|nr:hypothetical protein [Bdellovibrionales bacterium]